MKTSISTLMFGLALSFAVMISSLNAEPFNTAPNAAWRSDADRQAMVEKRLARLKDELKITPSQESAWQNYSDTMTQTMQRPPRQPRDPGQPQLSAPDRMSRQIEQMKQRTARMETIAVSLQHLYAQLSPEQRAIADQQAARFSKRHRH